MSVGNPPAAQKVGRQCSVNVVGQCWNTGDGVRGKAQQEAKSREEQRRAEKTTPASVSVTVAESTDQREGTVAPMGDVEVV